MTRVSNTCRHCAASFDWIVRGGPAKAYCSERCKCRAKAAAWAKANPERRRANKRASYARNRSARLAAASAWKKTNREKVNAGNRAWRRANPERSRAYASGWERRHPAAARAKNHRRIARRRKAAGSFTVEQLRARFAFFGDRCVYCGTAERLTIDHAIPLARGGTNWPANIVPACLSCNSAKGARTTFARRAA